MGLWINTKYEGLAHLKANGSWQVFSTGSGRSDLPDVRYFGQLLISDDHGGVWVRGVWVGGIRHLS